MFHYTDTEWAPWTVVRSNDKKRARLQAIRHVLAQFDYDGKDVEVLGEPDKALIGPPAVMSEHNPDRFWPERFAPEHEAERPRFAYMPFAAGPRHCIGETFALYEMQMHLYKVARRYRLRYVPDKPLELEAQINLRTRHPLHMRLEARR